MCQTTKRVLPPRKSPEFKDELGDIKSTLRLPHMDHDGQFSRRFSELGLALRGHP
jgi:hypothetical protein